MASGTDILFGGTADGSKSAAPVTPVPTTDTSTAPDATIVVKPPSSGTDVLFAPSPTDLSKVKPGDIDPQGLPYQFLTTPNTPVATTLGQPSVEGQQPNADIQAKIGTATDPEQRRRIAAAQLFPDLPLKEQLARVFYGADGRLAAVGEGGKSFYVDPLPVLSGGPAGERPTRGAPPQAAPTPAPPDATWEQRVQAGMPPGTYGAPSYQPPQGSVSPFTPGALNAPNVWGNVGRAVPNALSVGPMIAGDIVGGPVGVGVGSFVSDYARQFAANRFDPQPGGNPYDYGAYARNAAVNALTGAAAKEASTMARPGAVTSAPLTAQQTEQARLAQVAKDNDISIYPHTAPGASPLTVRVANVAQNLPFSGIPSAARANMENLTAGALKEAGDTSGAKALTSGVMTDNFDRVGKGFDNILPQMNAPIMGNRDALLAIQKTAADAQRDLVNVAPDSLTKAKGLIDQVLNTARGNNAAPGTISGTDLQNMVRKGGLFDKIIGGNDPYLAGVAKELKGTLIDSAKAAPGAAGDAAQEWAKLRYQYKVLMTLDTPALKNADNLLTPSSLQQAVRSQWGDTAVAKGDAGKLGDLAKLGQMITPPRSSYTAEHLALYGSLASLGQAALQIPTAGWKPLAVAAGTVGLAGATGKALDMYFRKNLANALANPNAYTGSSVVAGTAPMLVPQQRNPLQP